MTRALLLIGHGSRVAEGNDQFVAMVERVRAAAGGRMVEHCFIELAEPDIPTGIANCVARGAREVVVLPINLFAAGHAKVEIPGYLAAAQEQYPEVTFRYGRVFGIDPVLIRVLRERFAQVEAEHGPFDRCHTGVVVIGRGSSDADANSDVVKLARIFMEQEGLCLVETGFSGVAYPDVTTAIRRVVRLGARRVVVMPYLLFTGVLMQRIEGWVAQAQAEFPGVPMHLGRYLGEHPDLVGVILAREQEALGGLSHGHRQG